MIASVSSTSSVWYNSFLEKYSDSKNESMTESSTSVENLKKSETKEVDDYMSLKTLHRKKISSRLSKESTE